MMLTTKDEITSWLKKMKVKNYHINDDLTVDVDGYVNISHKNLTHIPVQFGEVLGNFYCAYNQLKSLEGCPRNVLGNFACHVNKLQSLKNGPSKVEKSYICYENELVNLIGCPIEIGGDFDCGFNQLTNFEGCPVNIKGYFSSRFNNISTIEFLPEKFQFFIFDQNERLQALEFFCKHQKLYGENGFEVSFLDFNKYLLSIDLAKTLKTKTNSISKAKI